MDDEYRCVNCLPCRLLYRLFLRYFYHFTSGVLEEGNPDGAVAIPGGHREFRLNFCNFKGQSGSRPSRVLI